MSFEHDKDSVEKMPFGDWGLQIKGSCVWQEQNRAQKLFALISDIMRSCVIETIPFCRAVRLVVVTSEFPEEVTRWSQQIGEPGGVSSERTVAKTLFWGAEYAVILLREDIAFGWVEGVDEVVSLAEGLLVHELAHVHDYYKHGDCQIPRRSDWLGICKSIARSTWGEFFAESVATQFVEGGSGEWWASDVISLLQIFLQELAQKISDYRSNRDAISLWEFSTKGMMDLFNQLGRAIGFMSRARFNNNEQFDQFFESIEKISSAWARVISLLVEELFKLEDLDRLEPEDFKRLEELGQRGFYTVGLYSRYSENGLKIDVQ